MISKEKIQEDQYVFPYHHLTHEVDGGIYIFRHLFWGLVHFTYINFVIDKIKTLNFDSLYDVGCGEGRIITELEKINLSAELIGVDISERAIKFAKAFSEKSDFMVHDITKAPLHKTSDVIISCEVIEHIEPDQVQTYVNNIHSSLNSNGRIIITTPTTNVPVNKKHYQHFTSEMFDGLLKEKFINVEYEYLNRVNLFSKILERLISNRFFLSNSLTLNKFVMRWYKKYLLIGTKETGSRIVVTAQKL